MPEQPDGIADDSTDLPDPRAAAERVHTYLEHYGDGIIDIAVSFDSPRAPLYARDLEALARHALARR